MTIDCIRERVLILEKMWNEHHNKKICSILLQQIVNDAVFFCNEKLNPELEERLDKLDEEIHDV